MSPDTSIPCIPPGSPDSDTQTDHASAHADTAPTGGSASSSEWFADDMFWQMYGPLMFDEGHWAEVPAVLDKIQKLTQLAPGSAILDSCCGVGRHSLELAARGYRVTGVDITQACLDAATESAEESHLDIEFLRKDIRSFVRPGAFDLCINLFTSFGYFADPADDLRALSNFRTSLKPGGKLVLEMNGKETAARDYIEGEWFERLGWTILTEFLPVKDWGALRTRWVLIRGSERVDRSFEQRLYAGTEMRALLAAAGFHDIALYGDFEGSPYDHRAQSLVAVAVA